ncbi:MAG TPA: SIS domain-containing protein [Candidatus Limnocylindrales bacterium]|nr:SIS domain-containing protein [Candidatus Limnocylindrales bacterium]
MTSMAEPTIVNVQLSRYSSDIHGQPAALRALADRLALPGAFAPITARWQELGRPSIVITGMGASLYAAEAAVAQVPLSVARVQVIATAQLLEQPRHLDDMLVIAVSQSGESVEIRELLDAVAADRLAAITNSADSSLGRSVAGSLVLALPGDRSVAIKTYTGTLAAIVLMLQSLNQEALAVDDIRDAAEMIETSLPSWTVAASSAAGRIGDARAIAVLGWGAMAATARAAALVFKEAARTPSEGMHADDFRHGSVEVVDSRFGALVFANSSSTRSDPWLAVAEITRANGHVVVIGGRLEGEASPGTVTHIATTPRPGIAALLTDIVPVQLLCARLAELSGFEAGEFRNTTPVITERPSGRLVSAPRQ